MVGVGVERPALTAARRLRPGSLSAKRSWPPGCGRPPPAPPPEPAPAAAAGDGEKGADGGGAGVLGGTAGEAIAAVSPPAQNGSLLQQQGSDTGEEAIVPVAVSPLAQNGALPQQKETDKVEKAVAPAVFSPVPQNGDLPQQEGPHKVEAAVATAAVSPVAQNGDLPQQEGSHKVEAAVATAAVSHVDQNGDLPQQEGLHKVEDAAVLAAAQNGAPPLQGQNKVDELVAAAADVSTAECNITLSDALPQLGHEGAGEDGDKRESREAQLGNAGVLTMDDQVENMVVEVAAPAVKVPKSCGIVDAASSVQNGGEGAGLSAAKEQGGGGSGQVRTEEVSADRDAMEVGNRTGGSGLERKENGVAGTRVKRWLTSALNPPPKMRAVSAVRRFPPGCGRTAVTTEGTTEATGVLEVPPVRTFPPGCGRTAVTTEGTTKASGVLEVSPISTFPPGCGRAAVTTTDSGVFEVSPIRTFPPDWGRSDVTTTDSGNEEVSPLKATPVTSGDAVVVVHSPHEGKPAGRTVDDKMKNKLEGSLHRSTLRTPLSDPIDAKTKGKRLESDKMNAASVAGKMQSKTLNTKKEVVVSNVNMKQNKSARKLKGDGIGKDNLHRESKFGKQVVTNKTKESDGTNLVPEQVIVQALMAPDKCPWSRGRKSIAGASKSRNKLKGNDATPIKLLTGKVASRESINDETMEDNDDSNMEDDNSKALVVYEEKREICVTVPPSVPFGSHSHQTQPGDARSRVKKLLQLFQATCRKLMQVEEQGIRNVGRVDLEAMKALKDDPIYKKLGPIVGNIPGVEIGDEFHFRVELSIVGLHRPNQAGIDTAKVNGVPVALSIVASGGYRDELSTSDELIYTGSGGKAGGNKEADDQKLERGNLALKNCIETKTPVRVIHGFKGQSNSKVGQSKGKQTSTFIYDGLYEVVECWKEGPKGEMVFKYKLHRIAGQPELALHAVQATRKSKVREGLCLPDISQGSERIPICVINTIDDMRPAPFKYITQVIYPPWYEKETIAGCDCTNGCSDSIRCACVVKNGGELPFNFNGAIIEDKPLVYECGPSCRCPPTCHNRVSQHGIKIPLEIFKTGKTGWGVRSLSSISSGSFICEYTGVLLEDEEAEKRQNDEYLFDIGDNYLAELKSVVGVQSSTSSSKTMEGFTIDAAKCGNVGRFINHSCSPNLYSQNVLWDHDDMRMPHVMFFALQNIPPLQELTYHYHYKVGQVHDKNGKEKVKHCYCGASDCSGRLY